MKIVCISDTHNKHRYLKELLTMEADLLLHAGDFSSGGTKDEIVAFNKWLGELEGITEKIIIAGNHDRGLELHWDLYSSLIDNATILHPLTEKGPAGAAIDFNGLRIYGEPRQPEFFNWAFNVNRLEMKDVWDEIPKPQDIDILLTHGPPLRCLDRNEEGEDVGCYYQREWIKKYQPMYVVCGHIHEGYGRAKIYQTQVINASILNRRYEPVNKPIIIEI